MTRGQPYSAGLMGALLSPQDERTLENGLVLGHAYTVIGIRKVGGAAPLLLAKAWGHLGECYYLCLVWGKFSGGSSRASQR